MTVRTAVRLAWAVVPEGEERRAVAWEVLRGMLAPGARLTNPCPRCGGPHGPIQTTDAAARPAIAYAGATAVIAVAEAGPGRFAIDAESERDQTRDAAGLDGVLGTGRSATLRDWVRVEASLKADGRGLRVDPAAVRVTATGTSTWVAAVPGGDAVEGWDLEGPPGIVVSAAISGAAGAGAAVPRDPATR